MLGLSVTEFQERVTGAGNVLSYANNTTLPSCFLVNNEPSPVLIANSPGISSLDDGIVPGSEFRFNSIALFML